MVNLLLAQASRFVRSHRYGCERGMDVRQATNVDVTSKLRNKVGRFDKLSLYQIKQHKVIMHL